MNVFIVRYLFTIEASICSIETACIIFNCVCAQQWASSSMNSQLAQTPKNFELKILFFFFFIFFGVSHIHHFVKNAFVVINWIRSRVEKKVVSAQYPQPHAYKFSNGKFIQTIFTASIGDTHTHTEQKRSHRRNKISLLNQISHTLHFIILLNSYKCILAFRSHADNPINEFTAKRATQSFVLISKNVQNGYRLA